MIDLALPLIGPITAVLPTIERLAKLPRGLGVILYGEPGGGKSHGLDLFAQRLTGSVHAIEHVNGQSLDIALVRHWRQQMAYGNLFSPYTVKRIDELDSASPAARNELLSLLDYLRPKHLILATTNDYARLRSDGNRRLESRFKCYEVNGPDPDEATAYLVRHFQIPHEVAVEITAAARADSDLGLGGVNMRLCVEDAQSWLAVQSVAA